MSATQNTSSGQNDRVEEYDVVILGGGTGSTIAAWTFAGQGQRVAVIDRKYIGGSCPNIACLPSKNIIHSAKVASYVRQSEEFGIVREDFKVDMSAVRSRKRTMVSGLNELYLDNYKKTGAEFICGAGRFIGPRTLEATLRDGTKRQLRGTNVIIRYRDARQFWIRLQDWLRRSHSRMSKHSNWTRSPNISLSSAVAMSE